MPLIAPLLPENLTVSNAIKNLLETKTLQEFSCALSVEQFQAIEQVSPQIFFCALRNILIHSRMTESERKLKWKSFFLRLLTILPSHYSLHHMAQQCLTWGLAYDKQKDVVAAKELFPMFTELLFRVIPFPLAAAISTETLSFVYGDKDLHREFLNQTETPPITHTFDTWLSAALNTPSIRPIIIANKMWGSIQEEITPALLDIIYEHKNEYSAQRYDDYFCLALIRACLQYHDIKLALTYAAPFFPPSSPGIMRSLFSKKPSPVKGLIEGCLRHYFSTRPTAYISITDESIPPEIQKMLDEAAQSAPAAMLPSAPEAMPPSAPEAMPPQPIYPPVYPPVPVFPPESTPADSGATYTYTEVVYPPPPPPLTLTDHSEAAHADAAPVALFPTTHKYLPTNGSNCLVMTQEELRMLGNNTRITQFKILCQEVNFSPAWLIDQYFTTQIECDRDIVLCLHILANHPADSAIYEMAKKLLSWTLTSNINTMLYECPFSLNQPIAQIFLSANPQIEIFIDIGIYKFLYFFEKWDSDSDQTEPLNRNKEMEEKIADLMRQNDKFRSEISENPAFATYARTYLELFIVAKQFNLRVANGRQSPGSCREPIEKICTTWKDIQIPTSAASADKERWIKLFPWLLPYLNDESKTYFFTHIATREYFAYSMPTPLAQYVVSGYSSYAELSKQLRSFLVDNDDSLQVEQLSLWYCLEILFMCQQDELTTRFTSARAKHLAPIIKRIQTLIDTSNIDALQLFAKHFSQLCLDHQIELTTNREIMTTVVTALDTIIIDNLTQEALLLALNNLFGLSRLDERQVSCLAKHLQTLWDNQATVDNFFINNPEVAYQILQKFSQDFLQKIIAWLDFPKCSEEIHHFKHAIVVQICRDTEFTKQFLNIINPKPSEQILLLHLAVTQKLLTTDSVQDLLTPSNLLTLNQSYPATIRNLCRTCVDFQRTFLEKTGLPKNELENQTLFRDVQPPKPPAPSEASAPPPASPATLVTTGAVATTSAPPALTAALLPVTFSTIARAGFFPPTHERLDEQIENLKEQLRTRLQTPHRDSDILLKTAELDSLQMCARLLGISVTPEPSQPPPPSP